MTRALALSRLLDAGMPVDDADEMADLLQSEDARAVEVVALAWQGYSMREIGEGLGIDGATVCRMLKGIKAKRECAEVW